MLNATFTHIPLARNTHTTPLKCRGSWEMCFLTGQPVPSYYSSLWKSNIDFGGWITVMELSHKKCYICICGVNGWGWHLFGLPSRGEKDHQVGVSSMRLMEFSLLCIWQQVEARWQQPSSFITPERFFQFVPCVWQIFSEV